MVKPPRIVVTDIDEDPAVKRAQRIKEIIDWSALLVIVILLWLMAATQMCLLLGSLCALITSLIATIQFIILIKSSYSKNMGNTQYNTGPVYKMPLSLHFRQAKEKLLCLGGRDDEKRDEKDTMNEQIPRIISPL